VRPRTIAKEIIHLLRSSIPSTIKISHHIASEAFIKANPTQIHQIIMNLCTNAAQAMEPKGGQLSISIEDVAADQIPAEKQPSLQAKAFVRLRIADTGDGIPPEIFHLIFEPYFTTKGPGEGTGMGLAMVQGIVESSGGLIEVNSTYGEGSTFTIYLPIISHQKTQHAYEAEALSGGKERVLLVDDEAPIAKMGSLMLERLGYDVTTHISSTDALEVFKARPEDFDVVITDMTMPNLTGDKLAIAVLNIRPDIPVILSTGYSKHISEETARDIGIKAFIYKPFVKADLASAVRTVLDGGMNL
jgi:CheY-like chemotaxis protein